MADTTPDGLFISEVLADNAGSTAIDTDGDGRSTKADEFIEIQNASGTTVDLSGYQIWSQTNGLLYEFQPGDTLAPGETATVLGEYTGTPPPGYYSAGIPNNANFLPDGEANKFDTIFLYDRDSNSYVALSYGDPPRPATPPPGFPPGATQRGAGETIDSNAPNGAAFSRDSNGNMVETTPTPGDPDVFCLVAGTRVKVPGGWTAVEDLQPGQLVQVRDGPARPLRAIGSSLIGAGALAALPHLAPVTLAQGTIGNRYDLTLSPNHRVMLTGPAIDLMFGNPEVLIAAKALAAPGSHRGPVRYFHLLFDVHALILVDGCWVETMFLGDMARGWRTDLRAQGQLREQDPARTDSIAHAATVRPCLRLSEVAALYPGRQKVMAA